MTERDPTDFRSGFIALAGVPNVGKSTLVNRLVGQKVSIVSPRPQTTRHRLCGILTERTMQAVLVDVPGILATEDKFNRILVECAEMAMRDSDIVLHLRSADTAGSADEERAVELLQAVRRPIWLVRTKSDRRRGKHLDGGRSDEIRYEKDFRVSAKTGAGIEALKEAFRLSLPRGPLLYPEEDVCDRDLRFLVAEIVREKAFAFLREEIPYGIATWTDTWDEESGRSTHIRVVIQTEREAHKSMIIGAKGSMLKRIGSAARPEIEELCGQSVYLELWVKVKPKWRRNPQELERLRIVPGDIG